jgi:hypothetical protein
MLLLHYKSNNLLRNLKTMKGTLCCIIGFLVFIALVSACSNTHKEKPATVDAYIPRYNTLASHLVSTGDIDFFHRMDYHMVDSFWNHGKNKSALLEIVTQNHYPHYARLLASEILFHSDSTYPPYALLDTLAYVYARALYITGDTKTYPLMGNEWGFMYYNDKDGITDYEVIGAHLMLTGKRAVPYLRPLLNDTDIIVYWGSEEATIGNSLMYRVKDAAAYYIGKITGIPVKYFEHNDERDAEIERLKMELPK